MELRELRYFIQIAKDHSYTRAAEHMYVSQPALSKMMRKLENELGVPLVESQPNGVYLTDYGAALYQKVVPLINEFDTLENFVADVQGAKKGTLRIGITPMLGTLFLVNIIVDFCNEYPDVELKIEEGGSKVVRQQVIDGETDIGFCIAGDTSRHLGETLLFRDTMVVCVHESNPLFQSQQLSFRDLKEQAFNFYSNATTLSTQITESCIRAGFQPKINVTSSKISMVMQMTRRGRGICILPRPYAARYSVLELKMIPLQDDFSWTGCLVKKQDSYQSYVSKLFEGYALDYFQKHTIDTPWPDGQTTEQV